MYAWVWDQTSWSVKSETWLLRTLWTSRTIRTIHHRHHHLHQHHPQHLYVRAPPRGSETRPAEESVTRLHFYFNHHQSSLLSTLSRLPPEVLTASLLFIIARLSALSSQRITSNSRKRSWPDNFTASRDLTVQSTLEEATLPPRMTYRRHPSSRKLARNREISELPRYLFQNFNAIFISVIKSVRQTGGHGCIFFSEILNFPCPIIAKNTIENSPKMNRLLLKCKIFCSNF